jgi:sugar O-acyltransferase (sialic acid O-acetyltransferase NeuD family)
MLIGFEQATLTQDIYNLMSGVSENVEIIHPDEFLGTPADLNRQYLVTVTKDKDLRKACISKLDNEQLPKSTFIHPSAIISQTAIIGPGTFVGPFVSVFYKATVTSDCIVGPYAMISHKSIIGQGCLIHPGTMIAGSCTIGDYCLLNIRSTVIDKLTICDDVTIGANALVTKSIDQPGHYVGSPARRVG